MRATLVVLFLLTCGTAVAKQEFDCQDLVGTWFNERFEHSLGAQRTGATHYAADGSFWIRFEFESRSRFWSQIEQGRWECSGNQLIDYVEFIDGVSSPITHTYRIEQLTDYSKVVSTSINDCSSIIGDCDNLVFQSYRIRDEAPVPFRREDD